MPSFITSDEITTNTAGQGIVELSDFSFGDGTVPIDLRHLQHVSSRAVEKVIEYCEHHATTGDDPEWDQNFIAVEQSLLFEILLVANFLMIPTLSALGSKAIAAMIKGKTPEEIRELFNIVNDFTPEEKDQIKKENEWAKDL
ncbi:S-phase kinase-associated protein 1A-like protein [Mycena sanguinolenta]|uniref:S-phase kinase-associated protein 1A-like protein n=1 Tax=Mycena sanguinolenta TaxID=230812 RepID=A0A8H7CLR7_9AGAR|nr:S-phase kinase-associated protein 1A-like protein [Mycena sanguinolenta]